jgi:hypothetical protein
MSIVIYISGETKQVLSVQPDMTNKIEVDVTIPDGFPLRFLLQQLSSLSTSLNSGDPAVSSLVFKITYG